MDGERHEAVADLEAELQRLRARVQDLEAAEERARRLIESSPMGMHLYQLEDDGRLVFVGSNPAADAILGVENAQFVGKTIEEAFPPLAGTEVPERYRDVCRTGEPWRTEQVDYEDEVIRGAFEVHAFRTGTRTMAATFLEITARKRTEQLAWMQRDLALVLASSTDVAEALREGLRAAIRATTLDSGGVYLVDEKSGSLVLEADEGLSREFVEWARHRGPETAQARLTRAGTPAYIDCSTLPPQARTPEFLAEGLLALGVVPIEHEGRLLACLNMASHSSADIPVLDRHALEAIGAQLGGSLARLAAVGALRASEEKYRLLVENQTDLVVKTDAQGRIVFASPSYCRTVGRSLEVVLEAPFGPVEDFGDAASTDLGEARVLEQQLLTSEGWRWIAWSITRFADGGGAGEGLVAVGRDVTDRRAAEEEMQALQAQLGHSQKMEAIGRLAGGVAHDFNNLLTGIIGYAELVTDQLSSDNPLLADVGEIRDAAQRAASLTGQLLAFSRRQVLSPKVLQVGEVMARSQRMLSRIIGEDVEFALHVAPSLWAVVADPTQVDQVLVNLATNARDAMPSGGRLTLSADNVVLDDEGARAFSEGRSGDFVRLVFVDTGHGMDRDIQARVFEPFFSTKGKDKGTGLGLSTVYGAVRQMGGFISVHSQLGHGTRFEIFLPRSSDEPSVRETQHPPAPAARGFETILLVEDEAMVRGLARRILRRHGYRVLEAAGGQEALAVAESVPDTIHLLLTDVIMPKMNGRELFERLRERRPQLQVVFMSGYAGEVISKHGVLDEGMRFVQKPFTAHGLLSQLREVLDEYATGR